MADTYWDQHKVPVEELCQRFETNIETGLTSSVAENRDYPNIPTPPPTTPNWVKLCGCLLSGPALPLLLGAILYFVVFCIGFGIINLCLAAGLILIVTVAGILSYFQQSMSSRMMAGMAQMLREPHAMCLRDGEKKRKKVEDLTVGDIVQVEGGDIVPADIRILESTGLKVDNSKLYGEPEIHTGHLGDSAAQKRDNCSVCAQSISSEFFQENHLESKNLAFYSTHVVEGSGVGMVVKTGDNTELAKNAAASHVPLHHKNVIKKRVNRSLFLVSSVIVSVGTAFFILALIQEYIWLYSSIIALSLIPVAIQASKEMKIKNAVRRLASKQCLVKDDEAVMTLGTISSLYTTKTGNVTQNRMTADHIWINNQIVQFSICDENEFPMKKTSSWKVLERAAVLCNNAYFLIAGNEGIAMSKRDAMGNTTDGAIFKLTAMTTRSVQCPDGNVMAYRAQHKKVCQIPFNSERKFQLSIHEMKDEKDGGYLVVMKGAPEKILKACKTVFMDNKESPIDEQVRNNIESAINELAGFGERVIAFCDMILPQNDKSIEDYPFDADKMSDCLIKDADYYTQGFRFLGLISLIDPPRAMVPDTIAKLKSRNLKVVMVTADHPVTAGAIAKSVGILSEDNDTVIHGDDVREMKDDQLRDILMNNDEVVFARTDPQTKSSIIRLAQSLGEVVAFAGTDLNDTPALKAANLGIAMGNLGSDAAENAADMVLLGYGMEGIVTGVDELKNTFKLMTKYPFNKLA